MSVVSEGVLSVYITLKQDINGPMSLKCWICFTEPKQNHILRLYPGFLQQVPVTAAEYSAPPTLVPPPTVTAALELPTV